MADWKELDERENVSIALSDEDNIRRNREGGNWWFEPELRLPSEPVVASTMTDLEAIEAVFGDWKPTIARLDQARDSRDRAHDEQLNVNPERSAELYRTHQSSQMANEEAWLQERAKSPSIAAPENTPAKRSFTGRIFVYLVVGCAAFIGSLHFLGPKAAVVALIVWLVMAWWI